MKFNKLYDAINNKKVILGVGPMSRNCIDVVVELANEKQIPMILVASRRQIECSELGGGYVWNTEEFTKYVTEKDKGKYVFIERDHGGCFQGSHESGNEEKEIINSLFSFEKDIEYGFDIIHIDLSKYYSVECGLEFFIEKCLSYASRHGKEIIFEVGTEEGSGQEKNIEKFEKIAIEARKLGVKFVVGNTGLTTKEVYNIGKFDKKYVKKMLKICSKNNLFFKVHNADYLNSDQILEVYNSGVHSINIAPELGVLETSTFLYNLYEDESYNEIDLFQDISYKSGKWKKWMVDDGKEKTKEYCAEISGHYVFNDLKILEMRHKHNFDKECKISIRERLIEYLKILGWKKELDENSSTL